MLHNFTYIDFEISRDNYLEQILYATTFNYVEMCGVPILIQLKNVRTVSIFNGN